MIMEMISIFLGVILLGVIDYGSGWIELPRLGFLVDMPSLVIILILTAPVLLKGGLWKDFKRAWQLLWKDYNCHLSEVRRALDVVEMMQKQVLYAGAISALLTFITILHNLSNLASLGPNLAVAILTMLYAVIIEMLLLPLQLEAKRRIVDYMEVDTDTEGMEIVEGKAAGEYMTAEARKAETEKGTLADKKETEKTADTGERQI